MISYYVIAKVLHIAQRISAFLFGIDSQKNKGVEQYLHRNACHCMRVDFAENGRVFTDVIQPEAPPPPPLALGLMLKNIVRNSRSAHGTFVSV